MNRWIAVLLIAAGVCTEARIVRANTPDAPRQLTASWSMSGSAIVDLKWEEPMTRPGGVTFYAVYEAQGNATTQTSPRWTQVATTALTEATLDLQTMGLQAATTMSFQVVTRVISLTDTLVSAGSNIAVAVWADKGRDTVIFVTTPELRALVGVEYSYASRAIQVGANVTDTISYVLLTAPTGMTIDAHTGMIEWTPTARGQYDVEIRATAQTGGFATQSFTITVSGGFGVVSGTVTDSSTGAGIRGAIVTFLDAGISQRAVLSAVTDSMGNFTARLLEGDYLVKANAGGYISLYWDGAATASAAKTLTVKAGDTLAMAVNFKLSKQALGKIIVNVLDDSSRGIANAQVTAILKGGLLGVIDKIFPEYGTKFTAKTDAAGQAVLTVPEGVYLVRADADGFVAMWFDGGADLMHAIVVRVSASATDTITFRLHKEPQPLFSKISGTVMGADSSGAKALAGARVNISMVGSKGEPSDDSDIDLFNVSVFTDANGAYSATVPTGRVYIAVAWMRGYAAQYYNGKTTPQDADRIHLDTDVANINFTLNALPPYTSHVGGQVLSCDSLMKPVVARVTAFSSINGRIHPVATTLTDSIGVYAFENLAPGSYILQAVPRGRGCAPGYYTGNPTCTMNWHLAKAVAVVNGTNDAGFDILVRGVHHDRGFIVITGNVKVLLDADASTALSGATVIASDASGNVVATATSDADGTFQLTGIDAGTYVVTIDKVEFSAVSDQQVTADYDQNSAPNTSIPATQDAVTAVAQTSAALPADITLAQNYPNPVNASSGMSTIIEYTLTHDAPVTIELFDVTGAKLQTLAWGVFHAGTHDVPFVPSTTLPAGTYFYRLRSGNTAITRQMLIIR